MSETKSAPRSSGYGRKPADPVVLTWDDRPSDCFLCTWAPAPSRAGHCQLKLVHASCAAHSSLMTVPA